VIEGDQQTMNDANRIAAAGAPVVQVNTGNGCHLDADMVFRAMRQLDPAEGSVLMIENVGNLVCPSLFDLGEAKRVVIMSITEGEDKPLKYPNMFRSSDLCVINKMDLLPHLDYDLPKAKDYALQVNHHLQFIDLSVKSGEGFAAWIDWLLRERGYQFSPHPYVADTLVGAAIHQHRRDFLRGKLGESLPLAEAMLETHLDQIGLLPFRDAPDVVGESQGFRPAERGVVERKEGMQAASLHVTHCVHDVEHAERRARADVGPQRDA
jgi:hydrogenase accessory protein HypB